jgi:hypothetical protein
MNAGAMTAAIARSVVRMPENVHDTRQWPVSVEVESAATQQDGR